MRIDLITIFPSFFDSLEVSLLGKARRSGLLDLRVHDLRGWALDKHRSVDDTPYGGGAGMVMLPEPWGSALDELQASGSVVVVPTPSGARFTQGLAAELATAEHLIFACGRYEGIDQRVIDLAASRGRLIEVSLGDYVLNGGEVAALAITEAVVRLVPGFMGNAESLREESHTSGLLEYPVYTKPASWRGRDVPKVLLSGDHARIAQWRLAQSRERTARRRPDLLATASVSGHQPWTPQLAQPADVGELWTLQRACWWTEAAANQSWSVPPLVENLTDVADSLEHWITWVLRHEGRLIGSVRGQAVAQEPHAWWIGRLMVAPDWQGQGVGAALLAFAEASVPPEVRTFHLWTGAKSAANLRFYRKAGYRPHRESLSATQPLPPPGVTALRKRRTQVL